MKNYYIRRLICLIATLLHGGYFQGLLTTYIDQFLEGILLVGINENIEWLSYCSGFSPNIILVQQTH